MESLELNKNVREGNEVQKMKRASVRMLGWSKRKRQSEAMLTGEKNGWTPNYVASLGN